MFAYADALSDCNKLATHTSFEAQIPSVWTEAWGTLACILPPSPPPATPQPQDGAIIEMTGDDPKLIFGTLENPPCQLSIDRPNSRLVSTCSIQDSRRLEEAGDCKGKYSALEKQYKAVQSEVSELRGLL